MITEGREELQPTRRRMRPRNHHEGSGNTEGRAAKAHERSGKRPRDDHLSNHDRVVTRRSQLVVPATAFGIDQGLIRFASALEFDR